MAEELGGLCKTTKYKFRYVNYFTVCPVILASHSKMKTTFCLTVDFQEEQSLFRHWEKINANIWFLIIQIFNENFLGKLSIELEYLN